MSGCPGALLTGKGVACLETAQLSGFGFLSLQHVVSSIKQASVQNSLPPILLHPCCNGCGWLAGLKAAEKWGVFFSALLKGKELHVLKPLNFERFRVSFL